MTVKYPVALEQGDDGFWAAYTLSPTVITGIGDSKEGAIKDLEAATRFWIEHMKETGQELPAVAVEVTSIEVAA